MARYYGTVRGQRGPATRLGHSMLRTYARTHAGAVSVALWPYDGKDVDYCNVVFTEQGNHDFTIYSGPVMFDPTYLILPTHMIEPTIEALSRRLAKEFIES